MARIDLGLVVGPQGPEGKEGRQGPPGPPGQQGPPGDAGEALGGLTFGQDAEGNWGYIPPGADAVVPFKKGGGGGSGGGLKLFGLSVVEVVTDVKIGSEWEKVNI